MIKVAAVIAVAASAASAQVWTLDASSLQHIRAAVAAEPQSFPEPKQTRLEARPYGRAVLSQRYSGAWNPQVWLKLNNTKDRVGAEYTVCSNHDGEDCATLNFIFEDLSVDAVQKTIKWGEDVVANWRSRWHGLRLEKGFALRSEEIETVEDTGFDRVKVARVRVYLQRR